MHWFIAVYFYFITFIECNKQEDNLKNVIIRNIEQAKLFQLPADNSKHFENTEDITQDYGSFDFVIVGAGSSGSVVANRLSEINDWNILLLEAGQDEDEFTDIPAMMFWSTFSERNWGYYSTSQTTCCQSMLKKQCFYPRGKTIGGTSAINGLMYARGNKNDFDEWENLGNPGWKYDDILKYFKKSENCGIKTDLNYHGMGGPMNVNHTFPESPLFQAFRQAASEVGLSEIDYNGKNQIGISRTQFNIKRGKRVSSGRAFLDPVKKRKNLNITTGALVTNILFDLQDVRAKGVRFIKFGKQYFAYASKEIILSAGALNTPQLLMLSGIGPKEHLQKHNISVIKNLPVGKYLKDHIGYFLLNFRTNYTEQVLTLEEQIRLFLKGEGDFTVAANDRGIGFINLDKLNDTQPNLELIFVPPLTNTLDQPGERVFNANEDFIKYYLKKINPQTDFQIFLILLHPKSEGRVTLKSDIIQDFPEIDLGFFADSGVEDLNTLYNGIQFVLNLTQTAAFRKLNTKLNADIKACDNYAFNSKEYWFCALRHVSTSVYHPMGTARMGKSETNSVVNSELKVHGIKNLRVSDCSVFPTAISGHPHAVAVMVGEKISDVIKVRYNFTV